MTSQTFYIEPDEEIISVIGRLRTSGAERNFFVFPKRALVLQSIINLRLFQREAQKLGKRIVIVTQDKEGRMLAEKAGLETEQYSDEFSRDRAHVELASTIPVQTPASAPAPAAPTPAIPAPRADMIGSDDFHASAAPRAAMNEALGQKLRIRNASPERQPGLNSVRYAEEMARAAAPVEPPQRIISDMGPVNRPAPAPMPAPLPVPMPIQAPEASFPSPSVAPAVPREERLRNFFADRTVAAPLPPRVPAPRPAMPTVNMPSFGRHASVIFGVFGVVALVSAIGAGIFFFLPKATVHVTPHRTAQTIDFQFDAVAPDGMAADGGTNIAARIVERDLDITVPGTSTGASAGATEKAHGTVVISNAYNADPQPLVATTRLETSDGKTYRLTKGVVVPGMTEIGGKSTPGAIEAEVMADQAGETYNIGPADFTIPGFKGSPKYAKFSAKSSKAFVGGGNGSSGMMVVAKADIDKAAADAKDEAKRRFIDEVSGTLADGEKVMEESFDAAPQSVSAPEAGMSVATFEYRGTFRVRAFIFSEAAVRAKAGSSATSEVAGIAFHPVSTTLSYSDAVADYDRRSVRVRAHALVTLESDVEAAKFKTAIAGQDSAGMERALGSFPGIKKISVDFSPEWFVSSVPSSEDRITVIVEPGEE